MVANDLSSIGRSYYKLENYNDALPLLQQALTIKEKCYGPNNYELGVILNDLANFYYL